MNDGKKVAQITADTIRQQALQLAEALRNYAMQGKQRAEEQAADAESIAAEITKVVDAYASHGESLVEYCRQLQVLGKGALGTVKEFTGTPATVNTTTALEAVEKALTKMGADRG